VSEWPFISIYNERKRAPMNCELHNKPRRLELTSTKALEVVVWSIDNLNKSMCLNEHCINCGFKSMFALFPFEIESTSL